MNRSRIVRRLDSPLETVLPGVQRRVLAHSEQIMLVEHQFEAAALLPRHAHPHEQLVYVVFGRLRFTIADEPPFELSTGESFVILGNVAHEAVALEASVVLDCFTPARQDYLP
ncbi:MAG TPA: cupin domain-containing protein [Chthonomonadaceae bacterium]|nr:cupin domain-containing protein [Chthonomonadaceae bacterium]